MLTKIHRGDTQISIYFVFKVAGDDAGQLYGI